MNFCIGDFFDICYLLFAHSVSQNLRDVKVYLPKLIREKGHYNIGDISITLFADGTFQMRNMPHWWHTDFGIPNGGVDSGEGTWQTEKIQEWWDLELNFTSRERFSDNSTGGFITFIPIEGDKAPYHVWFYIGDPDDGKVMIFDRVSIGK